MLSNNPDTVRLRDLAKKRKLLGICSKCKNPSRQSKAMCQTCADKQTKRFQAKSIEAKKDGLCSACCKVVPRSGRATCETCSNRVKKCNHSPKQKIRSRDCFQRIKDAAFAAYGGYCCSCCGENHPLFLEVYHVNNDGNKHRINGRRVHGYNLYLWLKRHNYPKTFQILCSNCNQGKRRNGGICPHETMRMEALFH